MIRLGQIYYATLYGIGHQQQGIRPVVIVSNNINNKFSPTVNVLPLTSQEKKYMPTHIKIEPDKINGLEKTSWVLAEQAMTINKNQLSKLVGQLSNDDMLAVSKGILVQMPLLELAFNAGYLDNYNFKKVAVI